MMNDIETYRQSGRGAGMAQKRGDVGAAGYERDWLRRALMHEKGQDKVEAKSAWEKAYREIATPSKPSVRDA